MRSALLTPILWGAPSHGETGEGGSKSRGRELRKTRACCFRFVYSHLLQFSLNSPRLPAGGESGREAAGCAVPEPGAVRAALSRSPGLCGLPGGAPSSPSSLAGLGRPGSAGGAGAGPAAASGWRGKPMERPGPRAPLCPLRRDEQQSHSRLGESIKPLPQPRGERDVRHAPRRRKVFQPPRWERGPAAPERGAAASEERGLTWG